MGDFLGFTFGGYHSSDLGITRVSGGDRYNEQLHPEIKDRTAEVPGLNGEYYFGSNFGSRQFDIEIAYDSLTEEQFKNLRRVFGTRDIKELIFDERPYKKYLAKLESPIELSYVCFDEPGYTWQKIPTGIDEETGELNYMQGVSGDYEYKAYNDTTRRVYKGEGKISFICYFPFAKSVYKQLPLADIESDWAISSGILSAQAYASVDKYTILNPPAEGEEQQEPVLHGFTLYNPGDIETGFRMYIPADLLSTATIITYIEVLDQRSATLYLKAAEIKDGDVGILIDTNNNLIVGVSSAPVGPHPITGEYTYTTSGNIYNEIIQAGYFFKIQLTRLNTTDKIQIEGGGEGIQIFYDYLYF